MMYLITVVILLWIAITYLVLVRITKSIDQSTPAEVCRINIACISILGALITTIIGVFIISDELQHFVYTLFMMRY